MQSHRARKRFGQHFLVDPGVVDAILTAIAPRPEDTLLEIGPGTGALTDALARRAGRLHLVELDRDLAATQRERWRDDDRVAVHEADALAFNYSALATPLRVVGNLPYNVSTPLLFHLLEHRAALVDMHFMLQKEVVDRIAAAPGSKRYGRLSVALQTWFGAEALFDVPPDAFDPPPAVNSAVLRLLPRHEDALKPDDPATLNRLLTAAFGQRRKTLRNALGSVTDESTLLATGIDPGARAETVDPPSWVRLANRIARETTDAIGSPSTAPDRSWDDGRSR